MLSTSNALIRLAHMKINLKSIIELKTPLFINSLILGSIQNTSLDQARPKVRSLFKD